MKWSARVEAAILGLLAAAIFLLVRLQETVEARAPATVVTVEYNRVSGAENWRAQTQLLPGDTDEEWTYRLEAALRGLEKLRKR